MTSETFQIDCRSELLIEAQRLWRTSKGALYWQQPYSRCCQPTKLRFCLGYVQAFSSILLYTVFYMPASDVDYVHRHNRQMTSPMSVYIMHVQFTQLCMKGSQRDFCFDAHAETCRD